MIKNIKLFVKDDDISRDAAKTVESRLVENGFQMVSSEPDLAIAVGGDGTFLRMMKECNFDEDIVYVGINSGTLGFLQEVRLDELDAFITEIKNDYYKLEEIGIQETVIKHESGVSKFYSLNEIVIRDAKLKVVNLEIRIDGDLLEEFSGDGVLISTSVGSTAHNLSYGGSIVYDTFSSLQITPIAPLNTKAYRSLLNSVIIPENKEITMRPMRDIRDFSLIIDGDHVSLKNATMFRTFINGRRIKRMKLRHHNFPQRINEKLLTVENSVII